MLVAVSSVSILVWRASIKRCTPLEARPAIETKRSFVASLTETLNGDSEKMWLNLGLWRDSPTSYVEAAEALACAVASKAGMKHGSFVADVGCGMGESVLYWQRSFGASSESFGINNSVAEVAEAQSRGRAVVQGDASALPLANESVDVVVALDSAYHFCHRRDFLVEAARVLRPGGTFGAADIVNSDEDSGTWTLFRRRVVGAIVGIPMKNVTGGIAQYEADLTAAGLGDEIRFEDVTEDVIFRGFATGNWTKYPSIKLVAWLLGFLMRQGGLCYVLVGAAK